jgi:2-polyprenyl-3-methyl-5-hydroxy-6-metoxy-1,4-benzoquinol methylase
MPICPYCSSAATLLKLKSKDYFNSQEPFDIYQCHNCQVAFTHPQPAVSSLSKYYESNSYVSHSSKATSLVDSVYLLARRFSLRWKLKIIEKIKQTGSILDYGCGTGDFLAMCKANGWKIDGVETSKKARPIATQHVGKQIVENLEGCLETYDIITLWHVLEHVAEPKKALQSLTSKLKEQGHILIAVPNLNSYDAEYYKEFWAAYDVPRHLWHMSQQSMQTILLDAGLKLKKVIPLKLDAYYISLLSSKYKGLRGIARLANSLQIGALSNFKARKDFNYSSLLYVATRQ